MVKCLGETGNKQNKKGHPRTSYILRNCIVTVVSPILFTSPKVKPHYHRCRLQSEWGWQTSLRNGPQGNFAKGIPCGD
jgi:hypothetical protein